MANKDFSTGIENRLSIIATTIRQPNDICYKLYGPFEIPWVSKTYVYFILINVTIAIAIDLYLKWQLSLLSSGGMEGD